MARALQRNPVWVWGEEVVLKSSVVVTLALFAWLDCHLTQPRVNLRRNASIKEFPRPDSPVNVC